MDVILFGDQTVDCQSFLKKALTRKGCPILTTFLEQAHAALQEELISLPSTSRRHIHIFSSISEFTERYYAAGQPDLAIESTITCLAQFIHFIGFFEEQPIKYLQPASTEVLGICTGLLAASAVASSTSLLSLIPLAVQALRIAFRLGSRVAAIGDQLESQKDRQQTWSTVVLGISPEDAAAALAAFNKERGLVQANKIYISAVGAMSITVSGSPSLRRQLFETDATFQNLQRREISIRGPYHASHLYGTADVDRIITPDIGERLSEYVSVHPLVGTPAHTSSIPTIELFRKVVMDILAEQVQWEKIVKLSVNDIRSSGHSSVRVLAMGPTTLGNSLVSALKTGGGLNIVLEDHVSWSMKNTIPSREYGRMAESKIAIVGMAGRFPNAADHELFWEMLEKGLDVHREVPPDRFDAQAHYDPSGKGKNMSHTPYGCFIDEPGKFDPRFFNMSPREATQTDPMQRLALTTAYEAMEMSGFVRNRTPSTQEHRIGTFYGQTSDDWREINAAQDIDTYFITGGVRAFGPGRINYHFGFSGPSFNVDTACSSSMAAIQLACTSLRAGDCDTVFSGGMNVMTNPDIFSGLSKGQFLSKTGSCKTYDDDADGYCRGDGVVTLILKRLEDAEADNDPILGVIAGIATNHSADAISITHPHAGAQKFLFQKVMDEAGVDIRDVKYVEMHGTGTQAGDGVEMESVSTVFAPSGKLRRRADQPLFVGSVKANIGHGEAVSGASALVKVLMMFQKSTIPPHCGIKTKINHGFAKDLKDRYLQIAFKPTPFLRPANGKRLVFMNNFSAAGGNTATLIEDAPQRPELAIDPRSTHVVIVTAKSLASFRNNIQRLLFWAQDQSASTLPSLAYTTTARRTHYQYRVAIEAKDLESVQQQLSSLAQVSRTPVSNEKPRIAFSFTGQGSHYLGMGKQLFQDVYAFRRNIEDYDQMARSMEFDSFIGLIDGSGSLENASPVMTQLAITCVEIALAQLWKSWGVEPSVVVGHSLGEYAALQVAGVLSIVDTIFLVGHRAQLLVDNCAQGTHGMLAVRAGFSSVEHLLSNITVEKACINGPEETVFSGTVENITRLKETMTNNGFKNTMLNVPYAFHSAQVDPILDAFKDSAKSVHFGAPQIPVISTLLGNIVEVSGVFGAEYLADHCRKTVDFMGGFSAALQGAVIGDRTLFVELGPHPICSNMIKSILGKDITTVAPLNRNADAWSSTANALATLFNAGLDINWPEYHINFKDAHEVLTLPSYAFDEKIYWIDYKGNWCLTKGEKQQVIPPKQSYSTTSVQRFTKERVEDNSILLIAETDLCEPLLKKAIEGHLVNGVPFFPSSIYGDMALTVGEYAKRIAKAGAFGNGNVAVNVGNMEVTKPIILSKNVVSHIVQIEANIDPIQRSGTVHFRTIPENGSPIDQAKCTITFEDSDQWLKEWDRRNFLVQGRIDHLKASKEAHKLQRGMAYKLFAALVQYDQKYRGMDEVYLWSEQCEATARVEFQASNKDGNFFMSPYFIDSLCHITGFTVNANDALDSKKQVYISHGWETMRFAKTVQADKIYQTYVRMQKVPGGGQMMAGDVYVFDGDEIIGVAGGVKFQCVPRVLLDTLLGPTGGASKPAANKTSVPASQNRLASPHPSSGKFSLVTKAHPKYSKPVSRGVIDKAMAIMADEIGCDVNELAAPILFADLGVDSLMGLSISGRFREELEIEFESSVFTDMPTVGQLKEYMAKYETEDSPESSGISTPDMISSHGSDCEEPFELVDTESESPVESASSDNEDIIQIIRETIAEEMGVDLEEITGNTDLATMGMDSLMSLSILGALRERTGLTLSSDLLVENTCIDKIERSLGLRVVKPPPTAIAKKTNLITTSKSSITVSSTTTIAASSTIMGPISSYPPAKSILLQGNPKTATKTLFLLPDGSGSATSYATIPSINSSVAVWGLNCPFMTTPEAFTIGVAGVTKIYMAEIQRRQPKGPYLLGGWSAGGVLAYEMTRQLLAKGEKVEKLFLIDSPFPIRLEALPSSFHRYCNQIGLLGDGNPDKIPKWLLPHFASAVRELTNFSDSLGDGSSIDTKGMPPTVCIWARDGLVPKDGPKPEWDPNTPMPNSMAWLSYDRKDLGSNGWEKLVGNNVKCLSTMGNHFTMMRDPITKELARLIKQELGL